VKLNITVDGKLYEVEVEVTPPEHPIYGVGGYVPMSPVRVPAPPPPAGPAPVAAPPLAPGGAASLPVNEGKVCRSPISGIVVRVTAQPGQQIQVGDGVTPVTDAVWTSYNASPGGQRGEMVVGVVNGIAYDAAQMVRLADMPPLPVLRAQLLGLLNAPATRLATLLSAPARQLATVVKAYADKPAEAAA